MNYEKLFHCQYHLFKTLATQTTKSRAFYRILNTVVFFYLSIRGLGPPLVRVTGSETLELLWRHDYLYVFWRRNSAKFDLFFFIIFWAFALLTYVEQTLLSEFPFNSRTQVSWSTLHQSIVLNTEHYFRCQWGPVKRRKILAIETANVKRYLEEKTANWWALKRVIKATAQNVTRLKTLTNLELLLNRRKFMMKNIIQVQPTYSFKTRLLFLKVNFLADVFWVPVQFLEGIN